MFKKPFKKSSFGKDRSFGGPSTGGRRFGGGDRGPLGRSGEREMFGALCGTCGKECSVPFRPNGRKPVLCSFCFQREGGGTDSRPSRPSFGGPRGAGMSDRPSSSRGVEDQLRRIETKLDEIIAALGMEE